MDAYSLSRGRSLGQERVKALKKDQVPSCVKASAFLFNRQKTLFFPSPFWGVLKFAYFNTYPIDSKSGGPFWVSHMAVAKTCESPLPWLVRAIGTGATSDLVGQEADSDGKGELAVSQLLLLARESLLRNRRHAPKRNHGKAIFPQ